ncbi:CCA tRNA nucleotidyltransferase [Peptococcus simiae]|uniref:CCA tRNA nucleotidyltransferase n=1 Tax=Peptococcus simiae TaxID=1643805 RepID=A0ABW9GZS9_9FIRM
MPITLPKACADILKKLNDAGYESYIVGGCVRDALLGKTPGDWDICTSAQPEEMLTVFRGYRVIPTGIKHGTLTVLSQGTPFEVTSYRIDGEYKDHRRPEAVAYTRDLAEDLARRDFTVNAMAWHPEEGLIDLYGGRADLDRRLMRAVGDPLVRFEEDGLRLMRLVRFATVLSFDYEPATAAAAKASAHLLKYISKERIQVELNKILTAPYVAKGLLDLRDFGLLGQVVPYLCPAVGFDQKTSRHFLDVYEHTVLATGLIQPDLTLRLTMFLHDIGKPFTWTLGEGGEDAFPAHEVLGADLANRSLRRLKYDNATRREVVKLIAHHNDVLLPNRRLLRRRLRDLGGESLKRLIAVKVADIQAHDVKGDRSRVDALFQEISDLVDDILASGEPYRIQDLALSGQDLLDLGIQGRAIGETLDRLLTLVVDDPSQNTREALLGHLSHP